MRFLYAVTFFFVFSTLSFAGNLSTFRISFKTLSCDGSKGFALVDADRIVKIESSKCEKDDPVAEIYQRLINSERGSSYTYLVFTTTEQEAKRIMERVDKFQEDKASSIREGRHIIIE